MSSPVVSGEQAEPWELAGRTEKDWLSDKICLRFPGGVGWHTVEGLTLAAL